MPSRWLKFQCRLGRVRQDSDIIFRGFCNKPESSRTLDPRALQPNRQDRRQNSLATAGARNGWFAVGIFRNKHLSNHGSLWRSAWHLGAGFLFTIEDRLGNQLGDNKTDFFADTSNAWERLPSFRFQQFDALFDVSPEGAALVAVEMGGQPLETFEHPERAIYILGSEDQGLPPSIVSKCTHHISIPTVREASLNVAACGAIVMYDREQKFLKGCSANSLSSRAADGKFQTDRKGKWYGKEAHPEANGSNGVQPSFSWKSTKRLGLNKASEFLAEYASSVGGDSPLLRLRMFLDNSDGHFVSKMSPPELALGKKFSSEAPSSEVTPCRDVTSTPQFLKSLPPRSWVAFRPLLLHVRCESIQAAHQLIKECSGLADVSVTSVDRAKIMVRIQGRGRALEVPAPTACVESVVAANAAFRLSESLRAAVEEIQLLVARLERNHLSSARAAVGS